MKFLLTSWWNICSTRTIYKKENKKLFNHQNFDNGLLRRVNLLKVMKNVMGKVKNMIGEVNNTVDEVENIAGEVKNVICEFKNIVGEVKNAAEVSDLSRQNKK